MSEFTNRKAWCIRSGRYKYTTIGKGLVWERDFKGSGLWFKVPKDFAFEPSIPWYGRIFFNPHDQRFLAASCMHDYALHILKWDRGAASGLFHDALIADGVSQRRAAFMTYVTLPDWRTS